MNLKRILDQILIKISFHKNNRATKFRPPDLLSAQCGFLAVYSNGFFFKKPWKYILLSTHAY